MRRFSRNGIKCSDHIEHFEHILILRGFEKEKYDHWREHIEHIESGYDQYDHSDEHFLGGLNP